MTIIVALVLSETIVTTKKNKDNTFECFVRDIKLYCT